MKRRGGEAPWSKGGGKRHCGPGQDQGQGPVQGGFQPTPPVPFYQNAIPHTGFGSWMNAGWIYGYGYAPGPGSSNQPQVPMPPNPATYYSNRAPQGFSSNFSGSTQYVVPQNGAKKKKRKRGNNSSRAVTGQNGTAQVSYYGQATEEEDDEDVVCLTEVRRDGRAAAEIVDLAGEEEEEEEEVDTPGADGLGQVSLATAVFRDPHLPHLQRVMAFQQLAGRLDPAGPPPLPAAQGPDPDQQLSSQIWQHFQERRQSRTSFLAKQQAWLSLQRCLDFRFPGCRTHVFGSTLSGFGLDSSDMDMCIFTREPLVNNKRKRGNVEFLYTVRALLKRRCDGWIDQNIEMIPAKVPILKLHDFSRNLHVDISVNQPEGTRNSHLLFCYGQMDWRVRPMVLAVKHWAKQQGLNDASQSTLSSYALTLMVLNYLQCGVEPAVLPSAQDMYPQVFGSADREDMFTLPYLTPLPEYKSRNEQSLGSLLRGFFRFFHADFDFATDVCSVRTGSVMTNADCTDHARYAGLPVGQWGAYVCIEEPLDRTNAARATVRRPQFDHILDKLSVAATDMSRGGHGLNSLIDRSR